MSFAAESLPERLAGAAGRRADCIKVLIIVHAGMELWCRSHVFEKQRFFERLIGCF